MGALLLALVATMTPFVAEPDRAYAQVLSAEARLASGNGLTVVAAPAPAQLTGESLTQADGTGGYDQDENDYTFRIGFNDSGVIVTPTATDLSGLEGNQSQTIRVNGTVVASATSHNVAVAAAGPTTITIAVTAPAGNTNNYTVKVYRNRQNLSSNADLSSLSISPSGGLKLSSDSTPSAPIYEARVQSNKVTVSYSLSDSAGGASAVVTAGDGTTIVDSTKPNEITLTTQGGIGTFTVTVTPESGTAGDKTYTINVYRIRANPSTEARLGVTSGLGLTAHDDDDNGTVVDIVGYAYGQDLMAYDLTVSNDVDYVTLAPSVEDDGAHYVINPRTDSRRGVPDHQVNLRAGVDTTITVTVTAEDPSATETYKLKIYKRRPDTATNPALDDATLRALRVSAGPLTPAFRSSTMIYDVQVESDVEKVTVSYTPTNNLGGVTVVGDAANGVGTSTITPAYDAAKNEVTLDGPGVRTDITLMVTPENGDSDDDVDYTIRVYRLRPLASANAALNVWTFNNTPVEGFTAGALSTSTHNLTVPFATNSVAVVATPTGADTGATAAITPASPVDLTAGAETRITVTVTAEDRVTTATYTVIVYRERNAVNISDDATLSALSLSDGTLSPDFMSDRMAYNARVGNDVDMVTVSYTPTDNAGGVSVNVSSSTTTADTVGDGCVTETVDEVALTAGSNTIISLCVTPEAGEGPANADLEVYQITVYRENANLNTDAALDDFAVSDVNPAARYHACSSGRCGGRLRT